PRAPRPRPGRRRRGQAATFLPAEESLQLVDALADALLYLIAGFLGRARARLLEIRVRHVGLAEPAVLAAHPGGVVAPRAVLLSDGFGFIRAVGAKKRERFALRGLR